MRKIRWQPYPRDDLFGWFDDHPVISWVVVVVCVVGLALLCTWSEAQQ